MTNDSNEAFQRRLSRIAQDQPIRTYQSKPTPTSQKRSRLARAFDILQGLIIGAALIFCVRALRVHLFDLTLEGTDLLFFLDIAAAILTCWLWNRFNSIERLSTVIAQQFGIFLLAIGMHNLAFWAPHPMSIAMTGDWVRHQQLHSVQKSIFVGVGYIRLSREHSDYDPASYVTPKVVYRH